MEHISKTALIKSINYHGQTLHKSCETMPRLHEVLTKTNPQGITYKESQARQKYLSFHDRGKRLRLQEFIAKHATRLFDEDFIMPGGDSRVNVPVDETYFAANPPFEAFCNADKESKIRRFFETTKVGDTLLCVISNKQSVYGAKILVVEGEKPYVVADLGIKAVLHFNQVLGGRVFVVGDTVRTTVTEIVADADKLVIGDAVPFTEQMPACYKKVTIDARNESYDSLLHKNPAFTNPGCIAYLSSLLGLGKEHYSYINSLRYDFPMEEFASELRQQQAAKWAFKSVADGIEHFKGGRHSEAFQCLNKALSIDPRNVEGLVARGALFANSGNFKKAVEDFEVALKVNPTHANARKYMGETLVAFGRSHEEKNDMEEAIKAYEQCLVLLPYHEEARNSIEFLRSKSLGVANTSTEDVEDKKSKKDKKKKTKKRKRASSSGSSSSSSSSSSDSSSGSSSDSSSSSSSHSSRDRKKKKKKKNERKEKSLSPLSKRMQLMDAGIDMDGGQRNQCNPASFTKTTPEKSRDYEMRVLQFIEQAKGDSDYEDKVRKFLAETVRFKQDRKSTDEKDKKKKKKEKKDRKEKSKKRKRELKEEKKRRKRSKKDKSYEDEDDDESERLREVLRQELTMKQELRRRVAAHEAVETDNVQLKLGGYYFKPKEGAKKFEEKVEERRHSMEQRERERQSPKSHRNKSNDRESEAKGKKNVDIFEQSPPPKPGKIMIGPIGGGARYSVKKDRDDKSWDAMAMKRNIEPKPKTPPLPPPAEPIKTSVDKFSFRVKVMDSPNKESRRRSASSDSSDSRGGRKSTRSPRSPSYGSRSRSRSNDSRSRSRSMSGSRSRSYSRSRSRSPRRYMQRYRGNQRGTYYKPRFQNNMQFRQQRPRDGYMRGGNRGNYYQRFDRYDNRGRGRGNYNNNYNNNRNYNNMRGGRRGFYPRGPGQYYDRRRYHDDDRRRSRDRSRSASYEDDDPMRKVGAAKEKIDKRIEMEEKSETRRRGDEPLSEGEAPDSPVNGDDSAAKKAVKQESKEPVKAEQEW